MKTENVTVRGVEVALIQEEVQEQQRCSSSDLLNQVARQGFVSSITKQTPVNQVRVVYKRRLLATIVRSPSGHWVWGRHSFRDRDSLLENVLRWSRLI